MMPSDLKLFLMNIDYENNSNNNHKNSLVGNNHGLNRILNHGNNKFEIDNLIKERSRR
jgi:hypothetical protein